MQFLLSRFVVTAAHVSHFTAPDSRGCNKTIQSWVAIAEKNHFVATGSHVNRRLHGYP